jgi:hypothetical protein
MVQLGYLSLRQFTKILDHGYCQDNQWHRRSIKHPLSTKGQMRVLGYSSEYSIEHHECIRKLRNVWFGPSDGNFSK